MNKIILFSFLCLLAFKASAFRPVAHVILKDQVVESLPDNNPFKIAMKKYPHIASWGAVGPDLGYNVDLSRTFRSGWKRKIKNSWQLADVAHYHMAGTFVKNLVEEAERTKDEKLLAFAGGWITHIAGDFGSHGKYVKEEAGYYIAFEGGRELHSELEKISDTYLYMKYANNYCLSGWDFNTAHYWEEFFGIKPNPVSVFDRLKNLKTLENMLDSVEAAFTRVYKRTYEVEKVSFNFAGLASTYHRSVGEGLGAYAGFKQYTVLEAKDKVLLNERMTRIDSAFNAALRYGKMFLTSTNNYSDKWNLDIGENGEPTYVVRIDAAKSIISRTKNDLLITFKDKNGKESKKVTITTRIGPMKFAFYQKDAYFYAVNMGGAVGEVDCWKIGNIDTISLSIEPRRMQLFVNTFRIRQASVYYNGKIVASQGDKNAKKPIKLKKRRSLVMPVQNK